MATLEKLKTIIAANNLSHAILLEGNNTLKFAKFIATAAVCKNSEKPCGNCNYCIKAQNGNHPDIKYYQPTGVSKTYPVDLIREIRMDAYILPNEANKKVYILKDIDNISSQSQNALLKILEEPPNYILFILTCLQKSSLLETVLSRVMVFNCNDDDNTKVNAQHYNDALQLTKVIIEKDELQLLKLSHSLLQNKQLIDEVLDAMIEIFRKIYLIKSEIIVDDNEIIALSKNFTLKSALEIISKINEIKNAVKWNGNITLILTRFSALLRTAVGR